MTASDPDPRPRDEERDPEELGPHLQSELDELLAGLDDDDAVEAPRAESSDEEPASPLPKEPTEAEIVDDLGPHLQAKLHELLGEVPADDLPETDSSSPTDPADEASALDQDAELIQIELDNEADLAALEAIEALDIDELAAEANVEAELNEFLAEDDAALIPEAELAEDADSVAAPVDASTGPEEEEAEYYDDGVIDAVSLDDYDAQRERGELQDIGFQDDHLGLTWDEEAEFAEEDGTVGRLQSQLDAGEALLNEDPIAAFPPESPGERADATSSDNVYGDDELADLIDDLESIAGVEPPAVEPKAPAFGEAADANPFDGLDDSTLDADPVASEVGGDSFEDTDFADAPMEAALAGSDLFQEEPDDAPAPSGSSLGQELFEESSQGGLDEALAAQDFDPDEDLFDFASLESGGGFAADDALDIDEFLEAVGEGESFGSVDSETVEALAEEDDLFVQEALRSAPAEQASPALADIDAELEMAEGQAPVASEPAGTRQPVAAQGPLVLAGGGRTWAWWLAGVAILVGTNLAVATFLEADRDIARVNLEEARASLVEATAELAERRAADAAFLTDLRTPLALPETDPTSAFAQVHEALEVEDFGLARRRLYALLATVDRRESPDERDTIEAHAAFMIADVDRLEADAMGERP